MNEARFSRERTKFAGKLRVLDILQLSDGITPGTKKWEDFIWTSDDSVYVTTARTASDGYMDIINAERHCPPETKDSMKLLIDDFMDYDHGTTNGHRLLDKIALHGTIADCEKLGIKRGTALAKEPSHSSSTAIVDNVRAKLGVRSNTIGRHKITVVNEVGDARSLPEGIAIARVHRFIGKVAPTSLSQYESIGNSKRGLFESNVENVPQSTDKLYAWYIVRYEDTRGNIGQASEPLKLEIYFSVS